MNHINTRLRGGDYRIEVEDTNLSINVSGPLNPKGFGILLDDPDLKQKVKDQVTLEVNEIKRLFTEQVTATEAQLDQQEDNLSYEIDKLIDGITP